MKTHNLHFHIDEKEIKRAIKHYVSNVTGENVREDRINVDDITISHSEDERLSGVFQYSAKVPISK